MDENTAFYNSDGDLLIVPQVGDLIITTELGKLKVSPKEIVVLPRGLRFRIDVNNDCRGYVCEIFKSHFILPDLGLIGSNSLANPRDFEIPTAWFEDKDCNFTVINKYQSKFFTTQYNHSIFNVVAWYGNYVPYKYDLNKFNTLGTISFDHPDPSLLTVLSAQSDESG
jgi:homogentisate 1,2-dioxygenase